MKVGTHSFIDNDRPFVVECFCGSGRLTAAFRQHGFDAFGFDFKNTRLQPETPAVIALDLTLPSDQQLLLELCGHPRITYVHFAPPGGTASRARETVVKNGPVPLRSTALPRGLPDLPARDAARVASANTLYDFVFKVVAQLTANGIMWSIENPHASLFWWFEQARAMDSDSVISDVFFDHCMVGGLRPKRTRWRFFPPTAFGSLQVFCDRSHPHAQWGRAENGKFATAEETVYPELLCNAVVRCVMRFSSWPATLHSLSSAREGLLRRPSCPLISVLLQAFRPVNPALPGSCLSSRT